MNQLELLVTINYECFAVTQGSVKKFYKLTKLLSGNLTKWGLYFMMVFPMVHTLLSSMLQCFNPIGKKTHQAVDHMNFSVYEVTILPLYGINIPVSYQEGCPSGVIV